MNELPRRRIITAIVYFCLQACCSAGTIRHDVPDSEYLDLGSESDYESVGYLRWIELESAESASAVLIRPQWVLAAAHSIDGADEISFEIGDDVHDADQWIPYPDWTSSPFNENQKLLEGTDIGLVHLVTPVNDVSPSALYSGSSEFESTATIVGYGLTGTGLTGALDSDAEKRAGANVLDLVFGPGERILGLDFDNPTCLTNSNAPVCAQHNSFGSPQPLAQEFLPVFGDSGGGVFLDVDGEAQLAGIVSFFGSGSDGVANGGYGDTAGLTRVSKFLDWIDSEIGTELAGDFDQDGSLTSADLDLLTAEILDDQPFDSAFDLNSDTVVDEDDRRIWVEDLKGTLFGDVNFDTRVNASDLNAMALNWQQANRTWAGGDFDGSGFVDAGDLNLVGLNWQLAAAASASQATLSKTTLSKTTLVPESSMPIGIWLLVSICVWQGFRRNGPF